MFENLYTTKMSADKKQLQHRFSKIRSKNGRLARLLSAIMSITIIFVLTVSTIALASIDSLKDDKDTITLISDGKEIILNNKPFVENNVLYLPLRELFEKLNVLDDDYSSIDWDNGKITIKYSEDIEFGSTTSNIRGVNFCYGIEIDKPEITLNPPGTFPEDGPFSALPVTDQMNYAPVLKDSTTYVPWDYIDLMLSKALLMEGKYNLLCTISGDYSSAFVMPCLFMPTEIENNISKPFGERYHPVTKETSFHNGIDIKANEGALIYAATDGTVTEAGYDKDKGNYIKITNNNGVSTLYAHLSEINVKVNENIKKRDIIGKAGKTGMATGPHLHFEVNINDNYYDPEIFW